MTQYRSAQEEINFRDVGEGGLEGQTGDSKARGQEKRHQKKTLGIKLLPFFKDLSKIHT